MRSVLGAMSLLVVLAFCPALSVHAAGTVGDDQADVVWGQPDLFQAAPCTTSPTASSLCNPMQVAFDAAGDMFVTDEGNNRVLMYPASNGHPATTPTKVFGQAGSFTTNTINNGGPSASSLNEPFGVAVDANGTLFVSDFGNNRVLVYFHGASKPASPSADLVLGQPDFSHSGPNDSTGNGTATCPSVQQTPVVMACSLSGPRSLSLDANGDLLVPDSANNRVLLFPASDFNPAQASCGSSCYVPATMVWGQYGSFQTNGNNEGHTQGSNDPCPTNNTTTPTTPTQCTLAVPTDAVADAQGNLYIADMDNSRVLEYDEALNGGTNYRQAATMVYGQRGDFTASTCNNGGVTAASICYAYGIALDPAGNLWVADDADSRVLEFPPGVTGNRSSATTATWVLGQRGSFTSNLGNLGGVDGGSLGDPVAVTFDDSGNAFVGDYINNRVLEYLQPYPISARLGLGAGWNLLALPSSASLPYSASSVVRQVDQEGGNVSEVAVYANGRYQVFVSGYANDFAITPKEGFWVLATRASTWAVT